MGQTDLRFSSTASKFFSVASTHRWMHTFWNFPLSHILPSKSLHVLLVQSYLRQSCFAIVHSISSSGLLYPSCKHCSNITPKGYVFIFFFFPVHTVISATDEFVALQHIPSSCQLTTITLLISLWFYYYVQARHKLREAGDSSGTVISWLITTCNLLTVSLCVHIVTWYIGIIFTVVAGSRNCFNTALTLCVSLYIICECNIVTTQALHWNVNQKFATESNVNACQSLSVAPGEQQQWSVVTGVWTEKLIRSVLCAAWVSVPQSGKDNRGKKQTIARGDSAPVSCPSSAITSACCPPTPFVSTLSNSIISQSLSQLCRKTKIYVTSNTLMCWRGTDDGRKWEKKSQAGAHKSHRAAMQRRLQINIYLISFVVHLSLSLCQSMSYQSASICAPMVKIRSLNTDRPPTIHPGADNKQHRGPFEHSDSILATLQAFMSGKSAVWTIWVI